ncbi:MAG TPA: hypothetical protein VIX42_03915 [Edaphobacter sp.]
MFRLATALLCILSFAAKPLLGQLHAPWVSCWSQSDQWEGPKTVRTPLVTSPDGKLKAYAQIEASVPFPHGCENTVRLFVSTQKSAGFHQVFLQRPSDLDGNANSLGPIIWSPNKRWLLVEFEQGCYGCDGGGIGVLLYDRTTGKVVIPNLPHLAETTLNQKSCWMDLRKIDGFDASSRVHLHLADAFEEGEDQTETYCFKGTEEWTFDPADGTLRSVTAHP